MQYFFGPYVAKNVIIENTPSGACYLIENDEVTALSAAESDSLSNFLCVCIYQPGVIYGYYQLDITEKFNLLIKEVSKDDIFYVLYNLFRCRLSHVRTLDANFEENIVFY